jgi:glycosyltransferase involved in cell wall biosynthesis
MPSQQKSVFIQAFLVKRVLRKRMIADQFTFASNTYLARNNTSASETLQLKSLKLADRVMLSLPDLITNISFSELRQISTYLGCDLRDKDIKIIPVSVPAKPVAKLLHRDLFHIMWWGRINALHGLPAIVEACKILEQSALSKDWKLSIFATPDTVNELSILRKHINNAGLNAKVIVHVDQNFKNGLEQLICDECDLALGHFSDDSEKAKTIITHKLVDAMAFGVPVLNRSTSAVEELIDVRNEIFVCLPEAKYLAEAIKTIMENPEERTRRARNGHSAWKNRFSLEASAVEFGKVIRDFCEQK